LRFSIDFFNAFNHTNFDADSIQGTGAQAGFFYNGSGVNCGAPNGAGLFQPCSTSNSVISTYAPNPVWGQAQRTKPARELQYGLKLTF
jgi:hypothetical protein